MFRSFSIALCIAVSLFVGCSSATQNQTTAEAAITEQKRLPHVINIVSLDATDDGCEWMIEYDDQVRGDEDVQPVIKFLKSVTPGAEEGPGGYKNMKLGGKYVTLTLESGMHGKSASRLKSLSLVATIGRAVAQYEITVSPFFNTKTGGEFAKRIGALDGFQRGHIEGADDGIVVECVFKQTEKMKGTVSLTYKGGPYVGK